VTFLPVEPDGSLDLHLLEKSIRPDTALVSAMLAHPKLIERPIVVHDGRATVGRPPESVLDIL